MKDISMNIAYIILFTGIGLLAFTFISAYIFLINNPSITESLGIMGWIGAGLTARGIQLIIQLKRLATTEIPSKIRPIIKQTEPIRAKEPNKTKPILVQPSQK
jgi:hypothetical protein